LPFSEQYQGGVTVSPFSGFFGRKRQSTAHPEATSTVAADASATSTNETDGLRDQVHTLEGQLDNARRSLAHMVTAVHRATAGDVDLSVGTPENLERIRFRIEFLGNAADRAIADNGFSKPELVGRPYVPELAVDAINVEDFPQGTDLVITSVVEPLILLDDSTVQRGRVVVSQAGTQEGAN
jgi:hypothetical protein